MYFTKRRIGVTFIYVVFFGGCCMANIERLALVMPRYAVRGGSAVLKCEHSVTPDQLHKVEWQKSGVKIFQYIKGRKPPFRYFPTNGADLNKTNCNATQIELMHLDFPASGAYSCVVSMETPIFSKDSDAEILTVIEPQTRDPEIRFDKNTYEVGEVLQANCTTSPSRPPAHITWLINGVKADEALTRTFSNWRLNGHGYFEKRAPATKQLTIEVSELHAGFDGELWLTCMATIPGFVGPKEEYADKRTHSVRIEVVVTEVPAEIVAADEELSPLDAPSRAVGPTAFTTVLILLALGFVAF